MKLGISIEDVASSTGLRIEQIKKLQKDGVSEDAAKEAEIEVQEQTNRFIAVVDKRLEAKEKEIMVV